MATMGKGAAAGLALLILGAAFGAAAQTPGQIQDPSSYQGSMELQRQEQAQAQQQAQQNAQAQQRLDQNYAAYNPQRGGGRVGGPPPIDWWKKPPLDPAHNPLLGRWRQSAPPKAPQVDGVAGMLPGVNTFLAGAFAGGCDSIFGKGITAFEPDALMWVAPDGHEEILNHVAYRANGSDIVVITHDPGALPALFFALPNHDHAVVAFLGCALARQGVRPPPATPVNTAPAAPAGAPRQGPAQASTQAILSFVVATAAPEDVSPMPGGRVWISRAPPEAALAGGSGTAADRLAADCGDVAACDRDINAFTKGALGFATVDAQGHTQTPPLPPGLYYLLGVAPWRGHVFAWSFAVVLKPGGTTVALSQLNARRLK
jgi:hypothetical protein